MLCQYSIALVVSCFVISSADIGALPQPPPQKLPAAQLGCTSAPPLFGKPNERCVVAPENDRSFYLNVVHIIPSSDCGKMVGRGHPIILVSDPLTNSNAWTLSQHSLGLVLNDLGFDVWCVNLRGSSLTQFVGAIDQKYYQYGYGQLGSDTKVIINFILGRTGRPALHYVAFSSASALPYIIATENPDFCNKFSGFFFISPAVFNRNTTNYVALFEAGLHGIYTNPPSFVKQREAEGKPMIVRTYLDVLPELQKNCTVTTNEECTQMAVINWGGTHETMDMKLFDSYMKTAHNGLSARAFSTTMQWARTGKLQDFDWGCPSKNKKFYGTPAPPQWNLKACPTVKITIVSWSGDAYADESAVQNFANETSCDQDVEVIPNKKYGHGTFLFSTEIVDISKKISSGIAKDVSDYKGPGQVSLHNPPPPPPAQSPPQQQQQQGGSPPY